MSKSDLSQKLIDNGINLSYQRIQILEYIEKCLEERKHPTSEEIFQGLQKENKLISKATVYNTINLFEEKGLIKQINIDGKVSRYELSTDPHGHFYCKECGEIYDISIPDDKLNIVLNGFEIEKSYILFTGICKNCLEKRK